MEAKLARASHRHRQLNIHRIERHRSAVLRLQPAALDGLPQHHSIENRSSERDNKLAAIRHHRIKASDVVPDLHLAPPRSGALNGGDIEMKFDENSQTPSGSIPETSPGEKDGWRHVMSLEEVMVERKPTRKRDDSFELVCPPMSRVIVMADEPEGFPEHVSEKDDGWEKIGLDGEPDCEPASEASSPITRSWVGVVLGSVVKKT